MTEKERREAGGVLNELLPYVEFKDFGAALAVMRNQIDRIKKGQALEIVKAQKASNERIDTEFFGAEATQAVQDEWNRLDTIQSLLEK